MNPSSCDIPTLEEIRAEKARRRLNEFIKQAWHVVEPSTPYMHGWHIDAIAEHLEAVSKKQIKNLVINMPPRHMKSLAVSVFWPCWEWITYPETRWLFASYAASLSVRDSRKCRLIIQSPWYQRLWGHVYQLMGDQNVKSRFENDKMGYRLATSVGGTGTGEGGDRVVVDDPHNVNDAESDAIRESTLEWWDQAMSTRLNDPKTGARVIVMQRVHERDLTGHVLEQGGYEHLCLPAEYEPTTQVTCLGWKDPRTEIDELLWPERMGRAELDDLKMRLGSYGAAGQLQQRPSPAGGGILKRFWWRFWRPAQVELPPVTLKSPDGTYVNMEAVALPEKFERTLQSWDMAFKDTKASAYVVGQVWGKHKADKFLLDQFRDKMDFVRTVQAVRALSAKWPHVAEKLVEDKANGPAVIASLRSEIAGMIPVDPEGSKEARAFAVSPQIEAGNVYLPHPSLVPWVWGLIEECASFPAGSYADQVDALTQALHRMEHTHTVPTNLTLNLTAGRRDSPWKIK